MIAVPFNKFLFFLMPSCKSLLLQAGRVILFLFLFSSKAFSESSCYGTTQDGRLENGVRLPMSGPNFTTYSHLGWIAGRTFVHSKVKEILLDAYNELQKTSPDKTFVYAETGWKQGGSFKPHKTHQNGLSVDLMVPVVDTTTNKSVPMPTSVFNKLGYEIEFSKKGVFKKYKIDFDALGDLIYQISKSANKKNVKIWRVIFDPDMISLLHASHRGAYLKEHVLIPNKQSWVRHDEHIHIDFEIPCKPL